jgi:hypothetical protein
VHQERRIHGGSPDNLTLRSFSEHEDVVVSIELTCFAVYSHRTLRLSARELVNGQATPDFLHHAMPKLAPAAIQELTPADHLRHRT